MSTDQGCTKLRAKLMKRVEGCLRAADSSSDPFERAENIAAAKAFMIAIEDARADPESNAFHALWVALANDGVAFMRGEASPKITEALNKINEIWKAP